MNTKTQPRRRLSPAEISRRDAHVVVRKERTSAETSGLNFVLSDETEDRMGDIILSDAWQGGLDSFRKNPVALFAHDSRFPIGTWKNLRVEKKALLGELRLAPLGTSERIDEVRRLVEAGVLRACSVGFRVLSSRPRDGHALGGVLFEKVELVETSLCAIPANPNALIAAKSLGISEETRKLVFAKRDASRSPLATRDHPIIDKVDLRISKLHAAAQNIMNELERLVDRQDKCVASAGEAVANQDFARLRISEITGTAIDALIRGNLEELRRIEKYVATLKLSRGHIQRR
jgi:HK97 family phage prohead protease